MVVVVADDSQDAMAEVVVVAAASAMAMDGACHGVLQRRRTLPAASAEARGAPWRWGSPQAT